MSPPTPPISLPIRRRIPTYWSISCTNSSLYPTAPGPTLDLYTLQGIPQHVIRWNNFGDGTSGLAFTTQKFNCVYSPCNVGDGQLYVIDLPF